MEKAKSVLLARVIIYCLLFVANVPAFGVTLPAAYNDGVLSQHIKEADGTTGQNTDIGSGVKTGHIQDVAVTPRKIGFYKNVIIVATSGGDYASPVDAMNAITDASATNPYLVKIMPGVYDIGATSVQMKAYVDIEGSGENTTKITGNIISSNATAGVINGAANSEIRFITVEHTGGTGGWAIAIYNEFSLKITNVTILVSNASFGVFSNLTAITNDTTVMTNVKVVITGGASSFNHGIHIDGINSTLTNVQITGTGGSQTGLTIATASSLMSNVKVAVACDSVECAGINFACQASATMNGITTTATGSPQAYGIYSDSSCGPISITMTNAVVSASGGTSVNTGVYLGRSSAAKIDHSIISGATNTIYAVQADSAAYVGSTKLDGGPAGILRGQIKCVDVYNGNYDPITCP